MILFAQDLSGHKKTGNYSLPVFVLVCFSDNCNVTYIFSFSS